MPKSEDYSSAGRKTAPSDIRSGEGARAGELASPRPSSPFAAVRRTRFSSVPLVELKHGDVEEITFPASVELPRRHVTFNSDVDSDSSLSGGGLCSMSDTVESFRDIGGSPYTQPSVRIKHLTKNADGSSRFPKLDECAHFHYDNVELGPIKVSLLPDRLQADSSSAWWFAVQVTSEGKGWRLRRSLDNFQMLDRQLHRCVYDRKFSLLQELAATTEHTEDALRAMLTEYLERFSQLAGSLINCGPVLNWLELDNRGNRLIVTDEAAINTPAIAAAYVTKRYASQAPDEISLEVGDIISVIDMPPPDESTWWRGKKGFQVGFFPCECVEIIGDKVPQAIKIPKVSTKPVLRKHGKLIAFFRSFLLSRPSRRKLKQSGILKERVFGCDLGEHLMNTGRDIPLVLKYCTEFIEQHGIVDGIYRLSGVTSNIQKLRLAFDEDKVPNLMDEAILQDIHCVASLLKMYFRELPNPLLTFHLYDKFVSAVQADESMRLLKLRDVVQQLPPPHYRSLEYLMRHLSKVAAHGSQTGMTPKNVAIVWAPNLLRSRDIENGGAGALHVVGVQAVLTEYLIRYTDIIFSEKMPIFPTPLACEETPKKTRPKSLAISTPTKLLSLEEARSRALTSNLPDDHQKFIDVGGGEQTLPVKYHTVIDVSVRHRAAGKSKKSPSGWRSFFSRGWHTASERRKNRRLRSKDGSTRPKISSPMFCQRSPFNLQDKAVTELDVHSNSKKLRTVKSAESLFPPSGSFSCQPADAQSHFTSIDVNGASSQETSFDQFPSQEAFSSSVSLLKSSSCQKHMRSTSHDSYFERVLEVPSDEETEMEDPLSDSILMKSSIKSDDTDVGSDKIELCQSFRGSSDSPYKRSKAAQKQKLANVDSEASSPKLQKLSLKRVHHATSSSPRLKRKDNHPSRSISYQEGSHSRCVSTAKESVSFSAIEKTIAASDEKPEISLINEVEMMEIPPQSLDTPFSDKCLMETDEVGDTTCAEIHASASSDHFGLSQQKSDESCHQTSLYDESDAVMSASMEATLSESVSLSQLLSLDSRDGEASSDKERNIDCSLIPQDGSLTTPDSPTGDNLSEIPSSAGSEVSGSPGDMERQTSASGSYDGIDVPMKSLDLLDETGQNRGDASPGKTTDGKVGVENQLANQTKLLQITSSGNEQNLNMFPEEYSNLEGNLAKTQDNNEKLDNSFVENLILSPPENFHDRNKTHQLPGFESVKHLKQTQPRLTPEHRDVAHKGASNITVSGSLGNDIFRSSNEFFDSLTSHSKKRSCSEKISPVSPVEESKRRFESEIGRLIVRDRQMKLEMEQMKVERQKHKQKSETPATSEKSKVRTERKFADVVDFRKSPVKVIDLDKKKLDPISDDCLKSSKETSEKHCDFLSNHGYSRYIKLENKPSVRELLSKFEGQKSQNDFNEFSKVADSFSSWPKHSANVFCNVQVVNHSGPVASCENVSSSNAECNQSSKSNQSSKPNQNTHREHIFQTECVVRFPHPKSSSDENSTLKSKASHSNGSCIEVSYSSAPSDKSNGLMFEAGNSRTTSAVPDTYVKPSSFGSVHQTSDPFDHRGRSPHKQKIDSDQTNSVGDASPSLSGGSPFSTFKDSFQRANKLSLQRRKEFLQQLETPIQSPSVDPFSNSPFHTFGSFRSPTNKQDGQKRNTNVRQRPKSVPPSVCRLSVAPAAQGLSPGQTSSAYCEVPKTKENGLINGNQSSESSQQSRKSPPKHVRDRAAIFERSLSFNSYMERKPVLSCSPKCKAQIDSSSEEK